MLRPENSELVFSGTVVSPSGKVTVLFDSCDELEYTATFASNVPHIESQHVIWLFMAVSCVNMNLKYFSIK